MDGALVYIFQEHGQKSLNFQEHVWVHIFRIWIRRSLIVWDQNSCWAHIFSPLLVGARWCIKPGPPRCRAPPWPPSLTPTPAPPVTKHPSISQAQRRASTTTLPPPHRTFAAIMFSTCPTSVMAEMPVAAQRSSWSSSYITSPSTSNRSGPSQTVATVTHKYMLLQLWRAETGTVAQ